MASSPIESFLETPTVEGLDKCCKDDMLSLSVRFGVKIS